MFAVRLSRLVPLAGACLIALALLAPALLAPAPALAAPRVAQVNAKEDRLLRQINAARVQAGLRPVTLDRALITLARDRSADMANQGYFDHRTPSGTTFLDMLKARRVPFYMAGEIIAQNNYGAAQTVDQAYAAYMGSAEHRAIIMLSNWKTVGVGQSVDGHGMYYYTVIFAQPAR
ncbi:MAG TPA: CAP domain-containing protein [Chloroflexia bacterium]|nr:CAP domain-containing protein [Chloroflexia bacterium]